MRLVGFEPTRPFGHGHLKTASLPFLHSRLRAPNLAAQALRPT
ncbi:MAG: hypothetical protein QOJ01_170, partial [Solirubrobacterales bacterium]|nr:hypothetical protein [Solirubrobacterales bacterium]